MTQALWFESPGELAGAGVDYFGPVGRKVRQKKGSGKRNVADTANVVWVDLDPDGLDAGDEGALVAHAERWLEGLRAQGLGPSVYVFSGRGSWAFWKLERHVPQAEAESLMRRLYRLLRPGGSEHDVSRVARMPGSVNEKTGFRARVMDVDASRWDPVALARLLPDDPRDERRPGGRAAGGTRSRRPGPASVLAPGGRLPEIDVPEDLRAYMRERPSKPEREKRGIDGSALEQAIVARLVNAGCSDGQIARFFDHHALPRHTEELATPRGYGWLAMGIQNARASVFHSDPSVSGEKGTYPGGGAPARGLGRYARRWVIMRDMPDGLRKLELLDWARETFEIGRSQALRDLGWLEDGGYTAASPDARDGRVKRVGRTPKAVDRLANWRGPGVPFEFVKGLPDPAAAAAPPTAPMREPQPPERHAPPTAKPSTRAADPEAAERRRRERSLINDVYRIHIPGNTWKCLQLLTPPDEWARVRLHEQLRVGLDDHALPVHRSFISPRDPALGGPDADDPIEERTLRDGGYPARDRVMAVAAVLAPTDGGFEVATRTEAGERVPDVGLLVQAAYNFFGPLLELDSTGGSVFAARKRGKGKDTTFELRLAGAGIELPSDHGIDIDALLAELADQEAARALLGSLEDGWRLVKRVPW